MSNDMTEQQRQGMAPWVVSVATAVIFWLVWVFGVEGYLFHPDITVTLLGISVALNAGLVAYLVASRR